MHFITRSLGGLTLAGALLLSGCGDDAGLSTEDQALADGLAAAWTEGEAFEGTDRGCLAEGFVSGIGGASVAEEYGVTADNVGDSTFSENPLTEEHAVAAANEMWECDDFKPTFVGEILGSDDATDDQISCLSDAVSDEPLSGLLASTFMGDNAGSLEERYENTFEEEFFAGIESCGIDA